MKSSCRRSLREATTERPSYDAKSIGPTMKPNWLMMAIAYGVRQVYCRQNSRPPVGPAAGRPRGDGVDHESPAHGRRRNDHRAHVSAASVEAAAHVQFPPHVRDGIHRGAAALERAVYARRKSERPVGATASCRSRTISSRGRFISLAEELRAAHGDLRLEAILPAETLAALGLRAALSDLWKLENFMRAQAWVKMAKLKQPYRREVLENLRAVNERDIAAIVERVRSRRDVLRHARRRLQPRRPHASHAQRNRRRPSRPLRISGSAPSRTTLSGRAALDALSRDSIRRGRRVGRRSPRRGRSRPPHSWPHFCSKRPKRSRTQMPCGPCVRGSTPSADDVFVDPGCAPRSRGCGRSTRLLRCENAVRSLSTAKATALPHTAAIRDSRTCPT